MSQRYVRGVKKHILTTLGIFHIVRCNMEDHKREGDDADTLEINSPSDIGYYGRPITELKRDELISAITELAKMYKESEGKNKICSQAD